MSVQKSLSGVVVKDAEKGTVEAVFSTFNVKDSDGDVTLPGAIEDGMKVVISAYGHRSHMGELPVGKGIIAVTDNEAVLKGQFFLNTTAGRDTFAVVKELGEQQEWSYSLHDVTSHKGLHNGEEVNFLERIGLIKEVSPVLLGAGINTRTLSAKGTDALRDQIAMTTDVVTAAIDSAERVVALRAEKGKGLSQVNVAGLAGLVEVTERLKSVLDAALPTDETPVESADITPEDIKALAAEARRRDLFSNLNQEQQ